MKQNTKRNVYTEIGKIGIDDTSCTALIDELQKYQGEYEPYSVMLVFELGDYGERYYNVVHRREETNEEYNLRVLSDITAKEQNRIRNEINRLMAKEILTPDEKKELIDYIMESK